MLFGKNKIKCGQKVFCIYALPYTYDWEYLIDYRFLLILNPARSFSFTWFTLAVVHFHAWRRLIVWAAKVIGLGVTFLTPYSAPITKKCNSSFCSEAH